MIKVAICDDEKPFRDSVKKYVEKYLSEKDISYEIDTFASGKEFTIFSNVRTRLREK